MGMLVIDCKKIFGFSLMGNRKILTKDDEGYREVSESSNLYVQRESNSYLVFRKYQIVFMFIGCNCQYLVLNPKVKSCFDSVKNYIEKYKDYTSNNLNLIDRDSLKVNFVFDAEGALTDQTNIFPPGLMYFNFP
jgi:hypothetical protein